MTETLISEIGDCLDEIDEKVSAQKKLPVIFGKSLLSTTADLTAIYPLVKSLIEKVI